MEIRNIAIIAHVDHGKTSLTDALLRQAGLALEGTTMDTNALEIEHGITIYSKNASIYYKDTKINIVDTPGHADFGSEVERVLRSIDSVVLVVDAQEGPMPQTKFVLKKSLGLGLKPILLINKIDKPAARPEWVHDKVFELFYDLGATEEQLNFICLYAIAKNGVAMLNLHDQANDLTPLLDVILEKVPSSSSGELNKRQLRIQPFNLGYDNFMGRLAVGRIYEGVVKTGSNVFIKTPSGETRTGKITKIFSFSGLKREEVQKAMAGDIIMIAGLPDIYIGETICADKDQPVLPSINIDEPTISLNFLVNSSPFAGREGKFVTIRQIRERLKRELEINVGLKVDFSKMEYFTVSGRGELHIAILLENMRREGYELQVSQPQVITKEGNGIKMEPFEELTIDVPNEFSGVVIEKLSKRKGLMTDMRPEQNHTRITFEIPTRGLLGYRGEFVIATKGKGILCSQFIGFRPFVGEIVKQSVGSMASMANGKALGFALWNLQERGVLYIGAGTEVYEGMIIGNTSKGMDMAVNPTKGKELTNMRASGSDEAIVLVPPFKLSLERGLEIMKDDEYLEVTPQNIRLRKKFLSELDRTREKRKNSV
ncbi:MAG: translational GTPase TypA [Candidatus Portnoybacteria bacterium CG06_land_8_20_14_3_00_39_12]|uniref:50S ribosomal subunit assembly factor BipA n=3 Tax=Candidatus Portnoyibacteriota TaxID=1817913 RepID=A0A2M8KGE4_9BACT|nr:MAG: GTP-binding protein TypA [Parcubacteria group bacterium CG1_02_40_25]PIU75044.1 MAG: translational GTPase TypA [Candidatus Portnoybacteria bacterium CG06_land_8_20_14_3_00_39_12]PIZ70431.1 MAG: translational GTPase TypA [Candidatus Portnoybacteria bacterium CG_4_10_14_0_2_um_filter_39_11]PJE59001.1 MAG: translational GTPase TypA [Candidatus Portnoybacteria bacterium CG10_big_fil_rev_8_21_14_0_10_40_22]